MSVGIQLANLALPIRPPPYTLLAPHDGRLSMHTSRRQFLGRTLAGVGGVTLASALDPGTAAAAAQSTGTRRPAIPGSANRPIC